MKPLYLIGVDINPKVLQIAKLSAEVMGVKNFEVGLANASEPIVLEKQPNMVLALRLIPVLSLEQTENFLKNTLSPLLKNNKTLAILSLPFIEDNPGVAIHEEKIESELGLAESQRRYFSYPIIWNNEKIGISYTVKVMDSPFNGKEMQLQNFYTLEGCEKLFAHYGLEMNVHKNESEDKENHRAVIVVKRKTS